MKYTLLKNVTRTAHWAVLLTLLLLTTNTFAGTMQITPLRAEVTNNDKNAVFEIFNPTDSELSVQLQPVVWEQDGTEEIYEKTTDILAVPVLFKIPPRESQTVRAALMVPNQTEIEKSYRLIFTEIPTPRVKGDTKAPISLRMRLQINLPIFVSPKLKIKPELKFHGIGAGTRNASLIFENTGSQHVQIKEMNFINSDGSEKQIFTSNYFLPKTKKAIVPKDVNLAAVRKVIFVTDIAGELEYELN